ncbi:hypothetical protein [Synechococcus sp. PCC 7336]|uniref:hypothetical protein n=1 Tax=Synechococcus sp. PCC 7336 TaxID=195250 RepID=UPI000344B874|nr:hypothetical protein [Synechococcus sp. PCC 7336]
MTEEQQSQNNIILSNHRTVLDYRTNQQYSEAVDNATAYVAGAIDFVAYAIYAGAQLSVQAARALQTIGARAFVLGQRANEFYYDKGLDQKVKQLASATKAKISEYRDASPAVMSEPELGLDSELDLEPEVFASSSRSVEEEEEELAPSA